MAGTVGGSWDTSWRLAMPIARGSDKRLEVSGGSVTFVWDDRAKAWLITGVVPTEGGRPFRIQARAQCSAPLDPTAMAQIVTSLKRNLEAWLF